MAKLPSKQDLGGLPSVRSGRPIASVNTSAIGRGVRDLGEGIASLGVAVANRNNSIDKFETERKFQEFKWNQQLSLDQRMREMEPGQADNFAGGWADGYKESASEFLSTVPEKLRPEYDNKLFDTERSFFGSAATFARQEQKRFSLGKLEEMKNVYLSRAIADEKLDAVRSDYKDLLQSNPFLTPIEKDEEFRKGASSIETAHIEGRLNRGDDLDDILSDLYGRQPELDTDENPELRSQPISQDNAREPTTRFAPEINDAINAGAAKAGVDPSLMATFAQIESSGRANARTGSYKGLFQLSESEFRKYGGTGSIFDPVANAEAAARKIKAETVEFIGEHGRDPTALDLYLMHQQGKAGYAAHMANPDAPAWENMAGTGEGKQKGQRWAKKAIWGNIPDDVKEQFPGGVETVTSQDFINIWQDKVERIGGGSIIAAGSPRSNYTGPYPHLDANQRKKLAEKVRISKRNAISQEIKDGAAEIKKTGGFPLDDEGRSALQRAKSILTKNQYDQAVLDWTEATLEFEAMNNLEALPDKELQQRLDAIEPKPGQPLFEVRAKIFNKTQKQAEDLRDLREKDPAKAVQDLPDVRQALIDARENPDNPEFIQRLAAARIEAQEMVGVPPGLRSPITKAEARVLMSKVRGLDGKDLTEALLPLREQMETQYGPYARSAAVYAVDSIIRDKETSEIVGEVLEGAFRGMPAQPSQVRRLQILNEAAAASRAFSGEDVAGDPAAQYGKDQKMQQGVMQPDVFSQYGLRRPPQAAIDFLLANPATATAFNRKYGGGMAEMIMNQGQAQ